MLQKRQEESAQQHSHSAAPTRQALASVQLRSLWLAVGVLVGLGLLITLLWRKPQSELPPPPQASWQGLREQAWEAIQPRLQEADQAVQALAEASAGAVEQFFEQRKAGAQGFAATVLSWQSKWHLVKSLWPSADREGHRKFIAAQFAKYIFTADDLQQVIELAVADYMHGIEDVENQLLVAIRADLADFPHAALPGLESDTAFQHGYARMLAEVEKSVQTDLKVDVVRESGSLVTGEVAAVVTMQVATAVAKRLGMSTGILGAGAASSVATFGVGLALGITVDTVTNWAISRYYNPQGKIVDTVADTLDHMKSLLIRGDAHTIGLQAAMERLGASRAGMRRVALAHLVRQGS